jgi:ribokinase
MTETSSADVVVVGSVNMDLVAKADRIPRPGETVLGDDFTTVPGGKGANQAVGVARLGERVAMIGRVGADAFGDELRKSLGDAGVDISHIQTTPNMSTGIALIIVEKSGQNAICVASGANRALAPADVDAHQRVLAGAKVCLMQLEIPIDTVVHTIQVCRRHGVETIVDTAPATANLPRALFGADIVTPNAGEAERLTGEPIGAHAKEAKAVAAALIQAGCRRVVLKLGPDGAVAFDGSAFTQVDGHKVTAVDTTAAGDAFTAALAVARARGESLGEAIRYANAAGAIACTRFGAQPSMPTARELGELLGA